MAGVLDTARRLGVGGVCVCVLEDFPLGLLAGYGTAGEHNGLIHSAKQPTNQPDIQQTSQLANQPVIQPTSQPANHPTN